MMGHMQAIKFLTTVIATSKVSAQELKHSQQQSLLLYQLSYSYSEEKNGQNLITEQNEKYSMM